MKKCLSYFGVLLMVLVISGCGGGGSSSSGASSPLPSTSTPVVQTYNISGSVTNGGSVLSGVTFTISGGSATSDASGNYVIAVLTNGSYTITPSKNGFTFSPATLSVTVNGADSTGNNFTTVSTVPAPTAPALSVSTLAGNESLTGSADGTGAAAQFRYLLGITSDGTNLYVVDVHNNNIRKMVIATNEVTTLAGSAGVAGSADGTGSTAWFSGPSDITTDGTNLYVTDENNSTIRKIVIATGEVTTLAGNHSVQGHADGTGTAATFCLPEGITTDGTNLYVVDHYNHTIRKVVIATGEVTTLAGSAGVIGSADGTGPLARFNSPSRIATDGTNLYVCDMKNHTIRKIVIATGEVTTLAGSAGVIGSANGIGSAARFYYPDKITTDGVNLYVGDGNSGLRKVEIATGTVTTLAVNPSTFSVFGITKVGSKFFVTHGATIQLLQ